MSMTTTTTSKVHKNILYEYLDKNCFENENVTVLHTNVQNESKENGLRARIFGFWFPFRDYLLRE